MVATVQNIVAEQGAALNVELANAAGVITGRALVMHVRNLVGDTNVKLVASTVDGRLTITGARSATLAIPSDVMAAVSVGSVEERWAYDVESSLVDGDTHREWRGVFAITRDVTRATENVPEEDLAGLVRYDSPQDLTTAQKTQARDNIGVGAGGGSGDVVGPSSSVDDRLSAFDGTTGKLIKQGSVTATAVASHLGSTANPHATTAAQVGADPTGTAATAVAGHASALDPHGDRAYADSGDSAVVAAVNSSLSTKLDDLAAGTDAEIVGVNAAGTILQRLGYTITAFLAAARDRATHTGTQLAATISDFATAAIAAVTWSTITGKPSTFDPTAHKTSHATGGSDALTASDIGAATAGHNHTGTYQPLATVLTNTTASFTTAQETKLSGIETAADVTDAGNVGAAINGATEKTTPTGADKFPILDSAAASVLKWMSWTSITTALTALYATVGRTISAAGLATGGGDLSANRTITVTASTAANVSTGTATDSALTPGALKDSTPYYVDRAADWTLALTDRNKDQWFNNGASALVCTIPLNATVAFAVGDTIPFVRLASGTATIDAATSVTLNGVSGGSCTISTRYQGALLKKIATDSWVVSGDVSAVA